MKLKRWKYDEIMDSVKHYGDLWMNLDVERNEDGTIKDDDDYIRFTCRVTTLKETEKALYIELGDSWKTWVPKSAIA